MNVDNNNYEGIKVKEEVEDPSYQEINQESIEGDLSNTFIKQECKLEVDLDYAEEEHLTYDENLKRWTSTNANSKKNCYKDQFFQCPKCSVKTKYEANLNKHILFMHPKNKPLGDRRVQNINRNIQNNFAWQIAGNKNDFLLQKEKSLTNQKYIYNDEKSSNSYTLILNKRKFMFSCTDCSFHCNLKFEIIYHVYECHYIKNNNNLQSKIFVCPYCMKQHFFHQKKNHVAYCKANISNYLQCDHCSNYFKGKVSLREHIFKIHFKGGIFKIKEDNLNQTKLQPCPRCGKRYEHSSNLLKHVVTCGKKNLFHCSTCLFTTNYHQSLVAHILQHLQKSNLCLDISYGHYKNVI